MEFYIQVFINGFSSFLTPKVFPFLIIIPVLFEKLGDSKKEYLFNISHFSILSIAFYVIIFSILSTSKISDIFILDSKFPMTLYVFQVLFSVWILIVNFNNQTFLSNTFWKTIFKHLGIFVLSMQLTFASIANFGPILGELLLSKHPINGLVSVFALGLILPFILILFLIHYKYEVLKATNWWKIVQAIAVFFLVLAATFFLINAG